MVHSHPSGDAEPSDCDIDVTDKVKKGCSTIGIILADHVIIEESVAYWSFKEHNYI